MIGGVWSNLFYAHAEIGLYWFWEDLISLLGLWDKTVPQCVGVGSPEEVNIPTVKHPNKSTENQKIMT